MSEDEKREDEVEAHRGHGGHGNMFANDEGGDDEVEGHVHRSH